MNVIDVVQGTEAWKKARVGHVTASKISDVMAKGKNGKEATTRANYRAEIVVELLTGEPYEDGITSKDMKRGTEMEPYARELYQQQSSLEVVQTGFVLHPTIDWAGASPDGLVGDDGLLEIKCPKSKTHLIYLLSDKIPSDYEKQMLWQMACTGRSWCDFVSYDNRFPKHKQLFIKRLERNKSKIADIEKEVIKFNTEIDITMTKLGIGGF